MDERGNGGAEREMWRVREAALQRERESREEEKNEGVKTESDCFKIFSKFILKITTWFNICHNDDIMIIIRYIKVVLCDTI